MTLLLLFVAYALVLSVALAVAGHRSDPTDPGRPPDRPPQPPGRVLIVGGTGGTGRHLVAQALERGHTVTVLVRDPSKLKVDHPRLTVVQGDVLDASTVDAAVRGQDAVLCALGHKRYFGPSRILSDGTRNLVSAMARQGVRRLVCETSLGIGDSAGRLGLYYTFFVIPVILPFYYWDKTRQERIVAASQQDWVIVRPGLLTNAAARGRVRQDLGPGSYLWSVRIARADVAAFMLDQLSSDAYLRRAPALFG